MNLYNEIIIPVQTAATLTSINVSSQSFFCFSVQATSTGSGAAGTVQVQASDDPNFGLTASAPVNWSNISGASVSVSGAGSFLIPVTNSCYTWLRVVYTNTGTGTIGVTLKGLGP